MDAIHPLKLSLTIDGEVGAPLDIIQPGQDHDHDHVHNYAIDKNGYRAIAEPKLHHRWGGRCTIGYQAKIMIIPTQSCEMSILLHKAKSLN